MVGHTALHMRTERSASRYPDRVAIEDPRDGSSMRYAQVSVLSNRLRDRLSQMGVGRGDRVAIYLTKSADAVVAMQGILKAGAAYVPLDPTAPVSRNAYIMHDCRVKVVVIEQSVLDELMHQMRAMGHVPEALVLESTGCGGRFLRQCLDLADEGGLAPRAETVVTGAEELAYILYTSGSTGRPKGVMLSHKNAVSFVDWCSQTFRPTHEDRMSSHAPFHFDLSILDVHVALNAGATLVLFGHDIGKEPLRLAQVMAERRISIWYSAPSILTLLAQYGQLDQHDWSALRLILFAGEVFPVKHLRATKSLIPHPTYFNLYGPTETNVCTFYEIPRDIPVDRTEPYPIGKACSHLRTILIDDESEVEKGQEGELCVAGAAVMSGYWNLPQQTQQVFFEDASGQTWYRTGDIAVEDEQGDYVFRGRRDRMVKKRGYRVELGEVEACLYQHPEVQEAAVIAQSDDDGVRIKAFVAARGAKRPSLIEMKGFCSQNLPLYMVPDVFSFKDGLPKTSTDKIDYQSLRAMD